MLVLTGRSDTYETQARAKVVAMGLDNVRVLEFSSPLGAMCGFESGATELEFNQLMLGSSPDGIIFPKKGLLNSLNWCCRNAADPGGYRPVPVPFGMPDPMLRERQCPK